jgi:tryptophanyl-tRNA synthetase
MSKSSDSDNSRINLLDSPDLIMKKIKRCKTDTFTPIEWNNDRPECTNLLNIYQAVTNKDRETISNEVSTISWGKFKPILAESIIEHLLPIQKEYNFVISDEIYLQKVLQEGKESAEKVAEKTLIMAKKSMGLHLP